MQTINMTATITDLVFINSSLRFAFSIQNFFQAQDSNPDIHPSTEAGGNPYRCGSLKFDLAAAWRQGERTCNWGLQLTRPGCLVSWRKTICEQEDCGSRTCKPNSVCEIAPAGRSFLWAAHYCAAQATYPEVVTRRAGTFSVEAFTPTEGPSLFGLAPCGVCPARCITAAAVRSYRTFSPLPRCRGGMFSV